MGAPLGELSFPVIPITLLGAIPRQVSAEAREGRGTRRGDFPSAFFFCCCDCDSSPVLRWVTPAASHSLPYLLLQRPQEPRLDLVYQTSGPQPRPRGCGSFSPGVAWPRSGDSQAQAGLRVPAACPPPPPLGSSSLCLAAGRHEKIAPAWPGFRLRGKLIKDSVNTLRADGPQVLAKRAQPENHLCGCLGRPRAHTRHRPA